jgi:hypothetical protein
MSRNDLIERLAGMCCDGDDASSQARITFGAKELGAKTKAATIEIALMKVLMGSGTNSSSGKQTSLLSLWGKKDATPGFLFANCTIFYVCKLILVSVNTNVATKPLLLSDVFVMKHGCVIVLGNAICSLFDRCEMLYFLNMTDSKTVIAAKAQGQEFRFRNMYQIDSERLFKHDSK